MTISCRIEKNDGGAMLTTLTTDKGDEVKIYRWAHGDATIEFNPVQYDTNLHLPSKDDAVVFALNIAFALGADIAPNGPPPVERESASWEAVNDEAYAAMLRAKADAPTMQVKAGKWVEQEGQQ